MEKPTRTTQKDFMLFLPFKDVRCKQRPVCCGTLKRVKKVQWEGTFLFNSTGSSKDEEFYRSAKQSGQRTKYVCSSLVVDILETEH